MLDRWEAIDEVAQVLTVATSYDALLYQIKTVFSVLPWPYLRDYQSHSGSNNAEQFLHCTSPHDIS